MHTTRSSLAPIPALAIAGCVAAATLSSPASLRAEEAARLAKLKEEVVRTYAQIAHHAYSDSHEKAVALQAAVAAFTQSPSPRTLTAARQAWRASRLPYLQTEVFRFYDGPIDARPGLEGQINGWPLDEAYIDYVKGAPDAGIINRPDEYPELDQAALAALNEKGGERNISTGYHAIEFLLWGQDHDAEGPGNRPWQDYVVSENPNAPRRSAYLNACAALLVQQLEGLATAWAPGSGDNYRARFEAFPSDDAIRRILSGAAMLSGWELAGERIGVALETGDQEEEHSCFSDTTHTDMIYNCAGIANVVAGAYLGANGETKVEGAGLLALAQALDNELATELKADTNAVMLAVTKFRPPFDLAISAPADSQAHEDLRAIMESLNEFASTTAKLAAAIGVEINITPDEEDGD